MRKIEDVLLTGADIESLLDEGNYTGAAEFLFKQQLSNRHAVEQRYRDIKSIRIKNLNTNGSNFEIHNNPARITSTSAKTDPVSLTSRQCFLCLDNLPPEQKGIPFGNYIILVNPYPIFPEHFTIVHREHRPQRINLSFNDLLSLSKGLHPYLTLFYNGPECGASAPDHLHFQGGTKGYLPLEKESRLLSEEAEVIYRNASLKLKSIEAGFRRIILLEGKDQENLTLLFSKFLGVYSDIYPSRVEPLLNIVVTYDAEWRIFIFLREKHRPDLYYSDGNDKLTISPAAVDLSGIMIIPIEEDFTRADEKLISGVIREVTLDKSKFTNLKDQLKARL